MEAMDLVVKERFADDQRRVRVSLTSASAKLVALVSTGLEDQYRQLELKVGPDIVKLVYKAVDDLLCGFEAP